jgi:hypothetical protein
VFGTAVHMGVAYDCNVRTLNKPLDIIFQNLVALRTSLSVQRTFIFVKAWNSGADSEEAAILRTVMLQDHICNCMARIYELKDLAVLLWFRAF